MYTSPSLGAVLALVGVTIILVRGTIFTPLQRRFELFRCALCTGFWVGALSGLLGATASWFAVSKFFMDGGLVAVSALFVDAVLVKLLGD